MLVERKRKNHTQGNTKKLDRGPPENNYLSKCDVDNVKRMFK